METHDITTPILVEIQTYLKELVIKSLGKEIGAIDIFAGFFDLGMDSKMTMELVTELEEKVGHELYPTLLFEYQNIEELSLYLFENDRMAFESQEQHSMDMIVDTKPLDHVLTSEIKEVSLEDVQLFLKELSAATLSKSINDIDIETEFFDLGMDSKMTMELVTSIEEKVGHELYPTLLFEYQNIEELANYLFENDKDSFGSQGKIQDVEELKIPVVFKEIETYEVVEEEDEFDIWDSIEELDKTEEVKLVRDIENKPQSVDEVAIVGISGRFPKSNNIQEFWDNLENGSSFMSNIPEQRLSQNQLSFKEQIEGGFLNSIESFDHTHFSISEEEANSLNPQTRLLLEESWNSFEDAGINIQALEDKNVGVFIGESSHTNSVLANTISKYLQITGPSIDINSGSSSSLTAIIEAYQSIQNGMCSIAIAGGVHINFSQTETIEGEAVGLVVLKSLSKAKLDGDQIYGVIKGTGLVYAENSTNTSDSFIQKTIEKSGLLVTDIDAIETTTNSSGLEDIVQSFPKNRNAVKIGSLAQLGDLKSASGIAQLSKILLQFKKRKYVPELDKNLSILSGFNIPTTSIKRKENHSQIGMVTNFGNTGCNAGIILEEYLETSAEFVSDKMAIVLLSASNKEQLKAYATNVVAFLEKNHNVNIHNLAYTLQVGRHAMNERVALIVKSAAQLMQLLYQYISGNEQHIYTGNISEAHSDFILKGNAGRAYIKVAIEENEVESLAQLWLKGVTIDWNLLYTSNKPTKISLPTYPFNRKNFSIPLTEIKSIPTTKLSTINTSPDLHLFQPIWKEESVKESLKEVAENQLIIIAGAEGSLVEDFRKSINEEVIAIESTLEIEYYKEIQRVIQSALKKKGSTKALLIYPTNAQIDYGFSSGLLKTAQIEMPKFFGKSIGIDSFTNYSVDKLVEIISKEKKDKSVEVSYVNGVRKVKKYEPVSKKTKTTSQIKENGVYVITGGAGGLGLIFANYLSEVKGTQLILTGRSTDCKLDKSILEKVNATYISCDVTSKQSIEELIKKVIDSYGKINGIIHAAGILKDNYLLRKSADEAEQVLLPKINGIKFLDEATAHLKLDFMMFCASLSGVLGNSGQADYSSANSWMDSFAFSRNLLVEQGKRTGHTLSIDWPLWESGGMQIDDELKNYLIEKHGIYSLPTQKGLEAFSNFLQNKITQGVVVYGLENSAYNKLGVEQTKVITDTQAREYQNNVNNSIVPTKDKNIAIVAMSGRFSTVDSDEDLWEKATHNEQLDITKLSVNEEDYILGEITIDKTPKGWPSLHITKEEALMMSVQEQLIFDELSKAMGTYQLSKKDFTQKKTGVFIAAQEVFGSKNELQEGQHTLAYLIPNKVSYYLNLKGPSEIVNSYCTSTYVAIHKAIQSIESGECEQAIVGAVNLVSAEEMSRALSSDFGSLFNRKGETKSFSDDAEGFTRSEGVGILVIKPLKDANLDANKILGVIKSSAVNHGGKGFSIEAPNAKGIKNAIEKSIEKANVSVDTIDYIEAHGIANKMADAVELGAIDAIYRKFSNNPDKKWHVGTSKPTVGHSELVSGMASIIKVLKAFEHKTIPGIAGLDKINSELKPNLSLILSNESCSWKNSGHPRRAGLNSYAVGGVNAHLILEEFQSDNEQTISPSNQLSSDETIDTVIESSTEEQNTIVATVKDIAYEIFEIPASDFDENLSPIDYDFDSVKVIEFVNRINQHFQVEVKMGHILGADDFKAMFETFESVIVETRNEKLDNEIIESKENEIVVPVTEAQKGLWFLQHKNPELTAYNIPIVMKLQGTVSNEQIEKAYYSFLTKHSVFRLKFEMNEEVGDLVQYTSEVEETGIQVVNLDNEKDINQIVKNLQHQPFDLSKSVIKSAIIEGGDQKHIVFVVHHIVFDGSSVKTFLNDFEYFLKNQLTNSLNEKVEVDKSYFDYIKEEVSYLKSENSIEDFNFWKSQFTDGIEKLKLPYDQVSATDIIDNEEGRVSFSIKEEKLLEIKKLAKSLKTNLSTILLAAYKILLFKLSGSEQVIVKMPTSGRYSEQYKHTIGYFINMMLSTSFSGSSSSFLDLVQLLKNEFINNIDHLKFPYPKLVANLESGTAGELFTTSFVYQNIFSEVLKEQEGQLLTINDSFRQDLIDNYALEVLDMKDELVIQLKYKEALFKRDTVERHAQYFHNILIEAIKNSNIALNEINVTTDSEKKLLLEDFNNTDFEYPLTNSVIGLFEAQVKKNPTAIALQSNEEKVTYKELVTRTDQLASFLQDNGVTKDTFVGIYMDRSIDAVTAMLAILKAGGAYVPLDPDYPASRVNYILEDAIIDGNVNNTTKIVLLQKQLESRFSELSKSVEVTSISIDADWFANQDQNNKPKNVYEPSNLAYVIYTSGSTGKPKGVLIEHRSFIDLIEYQKFYFDVNSEDQFLQFSNFSFDASVEQHFLPLVSGATLHITPKEDLLDIDVFKEILISRKITHLHAVPSFLREIPFIPNTSLKRIISGGDVFEPKVIENWGNKGIRIIDKYGPTETTVSAIQRDIKLPIEERHIGKPIGNTKCYVVDSFFNLQPLGVPGELCIGGAGLARGYLNRADLTSEKFIDNPFGKGKIYKTGDLVRWLPSGNIEFLGRIDNQVKVNGFRIEIGEVETALNSFYFITTAVVVAKELSGSKQLVAYCKTSNTEELNISEVKAMLSELIPEYMIPKFIVEIDEIPLTPNGKVNRKLLTEKPLEVNSQASYIEPITTTEKQLAAIWEELVNVQKVGLLDNFFELGGHSLMLIKLLSRIKKEFTVNLSISNVFASKSLKELAQVIDSNESKEIEPIRVLDDRTTGSLSFEQSRLWFLSELGKGDQYNIPKVFRVKGAINPKVLENSLNFLINRHEALRTNFKKNNQGDTYQEVSNDIHLDLIQEDFSLKTKNILETSIRRKTKSFLDESFDLSEDLLIRALLIKAADEDYVFALSIHHIVFDGWSSDIFMRELTDVYQALSLKKEISLPELPVQYIDYAAWQSEENQSETFKKGVSYWKQKLEGYQDLELPLDNPRPKNPTGNGKYIYKKLNPASKKHLKEISKQLGGTLFAGLLSSVYVVLNKLSGQEDICLGIPVANRSHRDVEGVIGFFVNTIVNRIQFSDKETVASLFGKVQKELISGQDFQNISFDKVVDATQAERKTSISPIFQVIVNYLTIEERYTLGDATLFNEDIDYDFAKFDLNIDFIDLPEGDLLVSLGYNTDIFKDTTAEKILESLLNVLEIFRNETQKSVKNISIVSDEERITLLEKFNPSSADYPKEASIHEMFTKQVVNNPNAVALVFEGETISYSELDKRSNQLALYLQDLGVQKETLVGVCMDKSIEMMVSILGILKAGGAYVPIDATYPKDRIEYIIQDSIIDGNSSASVKLVLKQEDVQLDIFERAKDFSVVTIAKQWEENKEILQKSGKLLTDISGNNLAYIMYTSGSTGKPKGVMVEHKSVVRLVVNAGYLELNSTNTLLSTGAFSFDATTFDFFGALLNGGKLVLATKENLLNNSTLKQVIDDNKVDTCWITSSWLNQIIDSNIDVLENIKTVLTGGERLSFNHIKRLKETYEDITVINGYGPTENTTFSTTYTIPEVNGDIPIGTPISDDQAYIIDSNNQLQPIGVYGELCFGGNGVARGYLNRPDLTQEKFIDNPFGEGRVYRTGDIARWTPEGLIDFLGRKDNQVKIRGFRIELGEIEEALNKVASITDSTVVVKEHAGTKQLIAYCLSNSTEKFDTKKIKSLLEKELPNYMIPKFIFEIEEIPLTPNGKKNRKFFENKQLEIESDSFKAPITEIQKSIAHIWQELLEVSKVGLDDNFFELGGHSLLITKLLSLVNMNYNVSIPVGKIFESPTLQEFAALVEATDVHNYQVIERVSERQWQPLSFAQQRLWFLSELGQGEQYHVPYILKIKGELYEDLLQQSLNILIQRHESLRTRFVKDNKGKACQFIDERVRFKIEKKNIIEESVEAEDIHQICQHFINEPFNLSEDTLIRAMLLKLSSNEQIFVLSIHHIVFDGWSLQIFIKELKSIYENLLNNTVPTLSELPIQYLDYAAWEQELALQKDFKKKIKFWKNHLEGFTDLAFPTDFPRPKISSGKGKRIVKNIDASTKVVLENFSNENGGTLFASLLSSVYVLLHKYSAQEDICIGVPVANRAHQQVENLIGFFVNTVVNRIQLRPDISLETLFNEVQKELIVGQENQEVPFDKVVEALQPKRETSITPIFQVMVNYLQMSDGFSLGDTEVTIEESSYGRVKFDLNFDFVETKNDGLFISFGYSTDLFSEQTAERLLNNLITIINTFASNSDQLLSNYSFLNEENRQQLLVDFNTTAFEYEQDNQGVLSMLMEQVSKNPNSVAVKFGKESLTYQELYKRCSQLALYLQTKGVSPDTLVGIFMERSVEAIVTMFGILMAGAAYVPIDPEYPTNRIEYIINDAILQGNSDSETHIVITQERLKEKLTSIISDNRLAIVDVKSKWSANHDITNSKGSLKKYNLLDKLAYVIYTSGSTGNPKGVLIEHQNVINLIKYQTSYFGITTDDNILLFSSFSFDASIEQIYLAVLNGATIHITTKEELLDIELLQKMLVKNEITHIHAVPSFLKEIPFTKNTKLKRIISGGDIFEQEIVTNWKQSGIRIINEYGPTETTVTSIQRDITNTISNNNNIGKPLGNTLCYVVDQHGKIVPVGVPGELWIGGKGVARGYLNREELTKEKFIKNPFGAGKVYKTGDLVKWQSDGTIEFLGRIDQQVKVRGFRIELGEIENILNKLKGVKNAVVVAKSFSGNKQLVAYVQFVSKDDVSLEMIEMKLRDKLPEYMIPSFIIELDEIPLTPNKKIDRKYLESKPITFVQKDFVAPSSKTEQQLAKLWSNLLAIETIGIHDNFFELGGHSLLIVQLNQKTKEKFNNVTINIIDFINNPTIAQQAKLIDEAQCSATHLIPLSDNCSHNFIEEATFIIPGMPGVVDGYYELGTEFSNDGHSVFGIQMKGILPDEKPVTSIKEMAEHNINIIKNSAANRIRLIAHSYGGTVALEMLHQLSKTSIEVTDVIFIDSYAPNKVGKMMEVYKGLLTSLATIVNIEFEPEEITKFSKRVIKQPKHKRKEFVYNFLLKKGGSIDEEFYSRLFNVYMSAMMVKPEFTEIMSKEITLIIANATPEKIEAKHGWANYCSSIEVMPTNYDHFELVRASAIQKWKSQLTKLVM